MVGTADGNRAGTRAGGIERIRRRHVLYVEGFDPVGAKGYFKLFRRTCEEFQRLWPLRVTLQPLEIDSEDFAHWDITLRGEAWQCDTHYDFLRLEKLISSDMAKPSIVQAARGLGWFLGDIFSGAQFRIFRAAFRFALHLLFFQLLLLCWIAIASLFGLGAGVAVTRYLAWPLPLAVAVALAAALVALVALRPLADKLRITQINPCWATVRRFARGRPTWLDGAIEVGARHVLAAARADDADELVIVGHSCGGITSAAVMARALELDPDLGRNGPRLTLLTLGSVMPAAALHPAGWRMRTIAARLAAAQNLVWVDCQSRKDIMCFANFDPVEGIGVDVGAQRCNPLLWRISFKEMIAPEEYVRFRRNFFRMHYQYLIAGDRPAPYDYILLVAGPMPVAEWPARGRDFMEMFVRDRAAESERSAALTVGAAS